MRSRGLVLAAGAACLISAAGCKSPAEDSQVVARAGKAVLTRDALEARMRLDGVAPERAGEFAENWVNEELLFQEAKREGLGRTDEVQLQLEKIEKQLLIQRLVEKAFAEKIRISDAEIAAEYEKTKDSYVAPDDEVRALHILARTQAEAELALQEMRAGKPFEEAARERSTDAFRDQGGDMGFVRRSEFSQEIGRAVFGLAANAVSPVLRSPEGFHLFKVIQKRAKGEVMPLADAKNDVAQLLRVSKERAVYYDLLHRLKSEQQVQITLPAPQSESEGNNG